MFSRARTRGDVIDVHCTTRPTFQPTTCAQFKLLNALVTYTCWAGDRYANIATPHDATTSVAELVEAALGTHTPAPLQPSLAEAHLAWGAMNKMAVQGDAFAFSTL